MERNKKKIIRAVTVAVSASFYAPLVPGLRERGYEIISVSSPGEYLEKLRKDNVKCFEVPMERRISLSKDVKSLYQLIKLFRKEKPYMVHSMTPKAGMLCMLAGWMTGVPRRVHTFTGLVWPTSKGMKRKLLMATDWLTCACATHVIPEGQGVLNDLKNGGITQKPMKVLGYGNVRGIDLVRFSEREELIPLAQQLRNPDLFTFVFIGRLVGDKGINELIEAFCQLNAKNPKTRLWLIGPTEDSIDPLKTETWSKIKSNNSIEMVGPIWNDDKLSYLMASDCFVFPSYREGFPNTVIEAGAMGLPSIVTDINGSREIIENEINGLIVPSKNTAKLYEAMERIIDDDTIRDRMKNNSREMISKRFEQSFVQKCLLDFYDEIL